MSELLDLMIDAHGGIDRWNSVKAIDGDMAITGMLWARKGWPDALKNIHVTIDTRTQLTNYQPFIEPNQRSVFRPDYTSIETLDGETLKERRGPRFEFQKQLGTEWDDLNLAYFGGYAMWNYLTTPFIFTLPDFKTEEIEPWNEKGEKQRRLEVTFPDNYVAHCSEQTFYINDDGLIGRLDYSLAGGPPTAHYLSDYKDFGGIRIATKRRAHPRAPDGTAVPQPIIVAIDIHDIRLS